MEQINDKADIIQKLCGLLMNNKKTEGIDFINEKYPFIPIEKINSRQYSKSFMMKIFLRDGFIDRYSGEKLLFPGLIRLLTLEIPEIFKYHLNWKMTETHMIYWDMFPTIDHVIPISRGGSNNEDNLITTNQLRNSAKSNFTIEELGWELLPKGQIEEWDGLCSFFLKWTSDKDFVEKYLHLKDWNYIAEWSGALITAQSSINNFQKVKPTIEINNKVYLQSKEKQMSLINVRELKAGSLYKYSSTSKTHLVLSPYDPKSQKIITAVIDSPNSNPANVICSLGTERQNNVNVIVILNDSRSPDQIINQLPPDQKAKASRIYNSSKR